ncbi:MAG: GNAT family N-acetyltransferase [Promethearchaeota archaeon]|jgi:RimJ/RimL family protein N-acetyltransferase
MSDSYVGPAYRIETNNLIIRCYSPIDAPLLQKSVKESYEHLLPWMPWVKSEPELITTKIERLRRFRAAFDLGENFTYGIFDVEETELIGGTGLHPRIGPNAFEIGYWINVNHINKGYATEVAEALTKVAFEVEKVNRVEIHCDPENKWSAAIPKKLGFIHEATLQKRNENSQGELIDSMIWSLFKENYLNLPIYEAEISAFDVIGTKIM